MGTGALYEQTASISAPENKFFMGIGIKILAIPGEKGSVTCV